MKISVILMSTPILAITVIAEAIYSLKRNKGYYSLKDTINNVNMLLIEELGALPIKFLLLYSYFYIAAHYPLITINTSSIWSWLLLWLCVDCCYYWYHRASHRCTLLWIGHSVHHQSDHYNLSVALRQGFFQTLTSWVFYLPLALLGFPGWMFLIVYPLNTLYQFWLHIQTAKHLGWLEHIVNTPSHHRVHHGTNPQYIDKNYGGSLIIWDKFFGTFEPENEPVHYGITEPLDSWNPFYAQIKVIADLMYYGTFLKNKFLILAALLSPPEWILKQLQKEGTYPAKRINTISKAPGPKAYMLFNLALAIVLYWIIMSSYSPNSALSWGCLALTFLTLFIQGNIANEQLKVAALEVMRSGILSLCLFWFTKNPGISATLGALFFIINMHLLKTAPMKTLLVNN